MGYFNHQLVFVAAFVVICMFFLHVSFQQILMSQQEKLGFKWTECVFNSVWLNFCFCLSKSSEQKPGCSENTAQLNSGNFHHENSGSQRPVFQPVFHGGWNPETIGGSKRILVEKNGKKPKYNKTNHCVPRLPQKKKWTSRETGHGFCNIWWFPKIGVPQNGWFIMENLIKLDDLGGKPTIFGNIHFLLPQKPLGQNHPALHRNPMSLSGDQSVESRFERWTRLVTDRRVRLGGPGWVLSKP